MVETPYCLMSPATGRMDNALEVIWSTISLINVSDCDNRSKHCEIRLRLPHSWCFRSQSFAGTAQLFWFCFRRHCFRVGACQKAFPSFLWKFKSSWVPYQCGHLPQRSNHQFCFQRVSLCCRHRFRSFFVHWPMVLCGFGRQSAHFIDQWFKHV